jgi:2-keto-4-pentenoate hydratase
MHASPARLGAADYHRPGIEIEVAFRLAKTLTAGDFPLDPSLDAAQLFDAMTVSIELVDFRWQGRDAAPPMLRLADLQSHAALVLGDWVPIKAIDWTHQLASLEINGKEAGPDEGTHPCVDLLWAATQWARHAVARHGELAAGSVVTTGSWCGMVWLDGPSHVVARFDGIGQTTLTLAQALGGNRTS